MIGACGPVCGVNRIVAVCWIGDKHTYVRHQSNREFRIDVVRRLINECRQLSLIRRIQQEVSEAWYQSHLDGEMYNHLNS
jgi:hypothetical protein